MVTNSKQEWWYHWDIVGIQWMYCTSESVCVYILRDMGGMCVSMYLCVFSTRNTHTHIYMYRSIFSSDIKAF